MTLSTNVYILDPIDPVEVFRFCQELLGEYDKQHRTPDRQIWSDSESQTGSGRIANRLGQGLPAILDISYRHDRMLVTPEEAAQCDEWCDEDCTTKFHDRPCWLNVDFDTTYGYHDERGWGCGDLHGMLVSRLGRWLDARNVRWEWRNEFTGDVHGGEDRYRRLVELATGGFEASAWFRTTVLPLIAAEMSQKED